MCYCDLEQHCCLVSAVLKHATPRSLRHCKGIDNPSLDYSQRHARSFGSRGNMTRYVGQRHLWAAALPGQGAPADIENPQYRHRSDPIRSDVVHNGPHETVAKPEDWQSVSVYLIMR